jgi:mono/diheme cytochrome c family protein
MRRIAALLLVSLVPFACAPADEPKPRFEQVSKDKVAHGARLAKVLGCNGCHGADLTGKDWSDSLGVLWTANLTQSAARFSDAELTRIIMTGRRPDRDLIAMPSHLFTQLDAGDLAAVLAYVRSLPTKGPAHPSPSFTAEYDRLRARGKLPTSTEDVVKHGAEMPPDVGLDHRLGRYIVRATCAECHGMQLRGGAPDLPGDRPRPDLRIVAAYDAGDFVTLMRTGKAAGGREVGLMSEVSRNRFANFTMAERKAVHAYLVELAKQDP